MVDIERLQAVYDKRLARLKDLRKRQEEKEWMTDKICDYLNKVIKRASDDLLDVATMIMKEKTKKEDLPVKLNGEIREVFDLANEIIQKRYDYLEY